MPYHLSNYERESVIGFNAGDDTAEFYTADSAYIRKLDKLAAANPEQFRIKAVQQYNGEIIAKTYMFPKRFITIRAKDIKRTISEEQRAAKAERMRKMRSTSLQQLS